MYRHAVRLALTSVVLVGAGAASVVAARPSVDAGQDGPLFHVTERGLRLEYHAVVGSERVLDARTGRSAGTPEQTEALRRTLLSRFGADSFESLREPWRATIAELRALGYY